MTKQVRNKIVIAIIILIATLFTTIYFMNSFGKPKPEPLILEKTEWLAIDDKSVITFVDENNWIWYEDESRTSSYSGEYTYTTGKKAQNEIKRNGRTIELEDGESIDNIVYISLYIKKTPKFDFAEGEVYDMYFYGKLQSGKRLALKTIDNGLPVVFDKIKKESE